MFRKKNFTILVVVVLMSTVACGWVVLWTVQTRETPMATWWASSYRTTSLLLAGKPLGGELKIFVLDVPVILATAPGESISKVAARVAAAVNAHKDLKRQAIGAAVDENQITFRNLAEYNLSLCSTDKGLEIPVKPQEFQCDRKGGSRAVNFHWRNPVNGYDRIHITELGVPVGQNLTGTETAFTYDYSADPTAFFYHGKHIYRIIGVRGGVPSCHASCEVSLNER